MIPPLGNLLLSFLALVATFVYPSLPAGAPFDSAVFGQILQYVLISIAGWNVKAAAVKSKLPSVGTFFKF